MFASRRLFYLLLTTLAFLVLTACAAESAVDTTLTPTGTAVSLLEQQPTPSQAIPSPTSPPTDTPDENAVPTVQATPKPNQTQPAGPSTDDVAAAEAHILAGDAFMDAEAWQDAGSEYRMALELNPTAETYLKLAIVSQHLGQVSITITHLNEAVILDSELNTAWAMLAELHIEQESYAEALTSLDELIRLEPENAQAYLDRADCHREIEDFDAALLDANMAVELEPDNTKAYISRGVSYIMSDEAELALVDLNYVLELEPLNIEARYGRGLTYVQLERFEEAVIDFEWIAYEAFRHTDADGDTMELAHFHLLSLYPETVHTFQLNLPEAPGWVMHEDYYNQVHLQRNGEKFGTMLQASGQYTYLPEITKVGAADAYINDIIERLSLSIPLSITSNISDTINVAGRDFDHYQIQLETPVSASDVQIQFAFQFYLYFTEDFDTTGYFYVIQYNVYSLDNEEPVVLSQAELEAILESFVPAPYE